MSSKLLKRQTRSKLRKIKLFRFKKMVHVHKKSTENNQLSNWLEEIRFTTDPYDSHEYHLNFPQISYFPPVENSCVQHFQMAPPPVPLYARQTFHLPPPPTKEEDASKQIIKQLESSEQQAFNNFIQTFQLNTLSSTVQETVIGPRVKRQPSPERPRTAEPAQQTNKCVKMVELKGLVKIQCDSDVYILTAGQMAYLNTVNCQIYIRNFYSLQNVYTFNVKGMQPRIDNGKIRFYIDTKPMYCLYFDTADSQQLRQYIGYVVTNTNSSKKLVVLQPSIKNCVFNLLRTRTSRNSLVSRGILRNAPLFGNTLEAIYRQQQIPQFLRDIFKTLEMPPHVHTEGIYRTSGNLAQIQKLRFSIAQGRLQYGSDVDVLCGVVKLFFRELQEPVINRHVLNLLLTSDEYDVVLKRQLSTAHYDVLSFVIRHLSHIQHHQIDNKMTAYNLAVCWAPTLFAAPQHGVDTNDVIAEMSNVTRILETLILQCDNNTS